MGLQTRIELIGWEEMSIFHGYLGCSISGLGVRSGGEGEIEHGIHVFFFLIFNFKIFFFFLCLHLWHMEFPRLVRAVAASLHHSHGNTGSEPHL